MAITQLSAFLENRPGTLYDAVSSISDAGVNIRALSVADTRDFGILRLIVSDVEKTKEVLSDNVVITQTKVIAARMSDDERRGRRPEEDPQSYTGYRRQY